MEITDLKKCRQLHKSSPLISLHPFTPLLILTMWSVLEVMSRTQTEHIPLNILSFSADLTQSLVLSSVPNISDYYMLVLPSSRVQRFHILGACKIVHSVTRACVICRRIAAKWNESKQISSSTELEWTILDHYSWSWGLHVSQLLLINVCVYSSRYPSELCT